MRSRLFNELTSPELEKYFIEGPAIALLPVGSIEMHGPHLPTGTDTIIAKAFALETANAINGLVLPEIHYSWSGAPDGFTGTISIETELLQKTVEAIAVKCKRMGFKCLVLLSVHAPNEFVLFTTTRQVFEKYLFPVINISAYNPLSEEADNIFPYELQKAKEASLLLAALNILGQKDLYTEQEICYEDQAPPMPEAYKKIRKIGVLGYFMQDPRQHVCPSELTSLKKGLEFISLQVEQIRSSLEQLDKYYEESDKQINKGWWKTE